jgi:D-glycero-D-manno-heptose 1,7-bisphosphate phosphatase
MTLINPDAKCRIKAVVLDRDGTLIVHVPYLHEPTKVELLPGVKNGLRRLAAEGIKLYLHTNQSGVGRGFFSMQEVHDCNQRLIELLELGSEPFAGICIAPEAPEQPSRYRKPSPAYARDLMSTCGYHANELIYIGDRASDLQTAFAAGIQALGIHTGLDDLPAELEAAGLTGVYPVETSFEMAVTQLLKLS